MLSPNEKRLTVSLAAQENGPVFDLAVRPGTTPQQVLDGLNLSGYQLFDTETGLMFDGKSDLFSAIRDGAKVVASSEMVAGLGGL